MESNAKYSAIESNSLSQACFIMCNRHRVIESVVRTVSKILRFQTSYRWAFVWVSWWFLFHSEHIARIFWNRTSTICRCLWCIVKPFFNIHLSRFTQTPSYVSDMNECSMIPGLCPNGKCINTRDSYRCMCNQGYQLSRNGKSCVGECWLKKNRLISHRITVWWKLKLN